MTTMTPADVNTIVSANVCHYIGKTAPSAVAEWLGLSTCEVIRLLEGHESFTIDQLQTVARYTGASFLQLALAPGQVWVRELRQALTEFKAEGVGGDLAEVLWGVLTAMSKRTINEGMYQASVLLTEALQIIITNQILDDDYCAIISAKIGTGIMHLKTA